MQRLFAILAILVVGSTIVFAIYNSTIKTTNGKERKLDEDDDDQLGQFGVDRVKDDVKPVAYDGKRAMKYLHNICDLGPRISGSPSMTKQQKIIRKHFEDLGTKVEFQTFTAKQNSVRGTVEMTNIIISFHPEKKRRVILCSHYDTRPIADQEPDPRDWRKPFLSANDGGSGVALLMELGNHMKDLKTHVGVDFVIFDGEEYIFETEGAKKDRYFIGSEHFAKTWKQTKNRREYTAAILLDMIGGKQIRFPLEVNSYRFFPELCKEIWGIASEQNVKAFVPYRGHEVQDDHLSLQKVGIPAIDIIDFDYAHWHKLSDTPANCSGESMEQVAKVLSVWLQRTK